MGQNEREVLHPPPPVQGGVEGHQRKLSHTIHALYGRPFLCGHRPQTQWVRDFTRWIKQGSYYHRLVARQGHLHKCPHLVGVALPRWPQVTPSEFHQVSQKKAETPATSSSAPSTGAREAQDDVPAPMETDGVGDGQSWVDQVEASADDEFWRDRPAKHHQLQSRRWED